jgi:hypothetical protein
LKGRHFDTTEVVEVESQSVLNTFTQHGFQDEFMKWQKLWELWIRAEGDHFEVRVASGPKVNFLPDGSISN